MFRISFVAFPLEPNVSIRNWADLQDLFKLSVVFGCIIIYDRRHYFCVSQIFSCLLESVISGSLSPRHDIVISGSLSPRHGAFSGADGGTACRYGEWL